MSTFRSAKWRGGIKDGIGAISTASGALKDFPYGFSSRFEGKPGTNLHRLVGTRRGVGYDEHDRTRDLVGGDQP